MGETKAARNSQLREKVPPHREGNGKWGVGFLGVVLWWRVLVVVPQRKSFVCHEIVLSASWSFHAIAASTTHYPLLPPPR